MVTKDFRAYYKLGEDKEPILEMWSKVIIKRNDKLWEIDVRTGFDITGIEKEFEICLDHHINHCRRTYHLWKVDEDTGKSRGGWEKPFEFEDEEMTKEEYEKRFNEKIL